MHPRFLPESVWGGMIKIPVDCPSAIHYRLRMHLNPNKTVAWLLALLLALMPLQSLLASGLSGFGDPGAASMTMDDEAHSMDVSSMDCQNCDQHDCCDQGSCDLQHCLSCMITVAVIPADSPDLHALEHGADAVPEQALPSDLHNAFYRPPRG